MPGIDDLSEKWTKAREIWVEMNREAVRFGEALIKNLSAYLGIPDGENLIEPVPPDPQKLSSIVGPSITTDPKSRRLRDWMSEEFDVADALRFSNERRRFGMGLLLMVPGQEGAHDFVPFFFEFIKMGGDEYLVSVMGTNREFRVKEGDPTSFAPLFDFIYETLEARYPQSLDGMIEMLSGSGERQVGFRPKFN
ncbi:MAG: hypothetical protein ACP5QG_07205 [candidate division WOR-3 bacterium]